MHLRVPTKKLAVIAIFAAIYAVLNLIPVSRLVGSVSFLSMANVFSPLAGMVLGPATGGLSVLVGTYVSFAMGKTVAFDGLDFIPGVVAALTAGWAIRGRLTPALGLSVAMFAVYSLDPLSAPFIDVGTTPVPFLWMHVLAAVILAAVSVARRSAGGLLSGSVLTVAVVFASTMNGHVAGSIMGENVLFRINGVMPQHGYLAYWTLVFYSYPIERLFFTIVGSLLAIPVLRAIPPQTLRMLRGEMARAP